MEIATLLELIRQRWSSKTYRAATILGVLSFIELHFEIVSPFIPAAFRPLLLLLWPAIMLTMREYTTTALADKTKVVVAQEAPTEA